MLPLHTNNIEDEEEETCKSPSCAPHHAIKSLDSILEADSEESSSGIKTPTQPFKEKLLIHHHTHPTSLGACNLSRALENDNSNIPQRLESGTFVSTPRSTGSGIGLRGVHGPIIQSTSHGSLSLGTAGPLEDPIQSTTDDASVSKLSAVLAGYYEDPYLQYIVRRPSKRSPLINRGYFVRVAAMRKVISNFLQAAENWRSAQIVNIGAGLDTTYFWVHDFWANPVVKFFEVDFLEVITKKLILLTRKNPLWSCLSSKPGSRSIEAIESEWRKEKSITVNDTLVLIPVDFRQLDRLEPLLISSGFDPELPTLFLSECALVYVQASHSDPVVSWAANIMRAPAAFVMYEQINPHDPFGRTMISNLELRGCPLLSIHDYPTIESQRTRFLNLGWQRVTIANMNEIYDKFLDKYEVLRIQGLELFDEIEEWRLIQSHYFVLVAVIAQRIDDSEERDHVETSCFKKLANMWEEAYAVQEELPRFSTAELRANPVHSPIALPNHHLPNPGPLSPLVRPEATSSLLQEFPDLSMGQGPYLIQGNSGKISRKWSLSPEGHETFSNERQMEFPGPFIGGDRAGHPSRSWDGT